jgi:hypothetical protein
MKSRLKWTAEIVLVMEVKAHRKAMEILEPRERSELP